MRTQQSQFNEAAMHSYMIDADREVFFHKAFWALSFNGINGDYAEFGCHGGSTFAGAYFEIIRWPQKRHLWAFDGFQGLPEQQGGKDYHPGWKKGKMTTSLERFLELCRKRQIPDGAYSVVPGLYEETLDGQPGAATGLPSEIALAFIDCDLYSSTISVLDFLRPRLRHGMIIAFDDYFAFSDRSISGNRRAMLEHFTDQSPYSLLPFLQFSWCGMSFIVEDRKLLEV